MALYTFIYTENESCAGPAEKIAMEISDDDYCLDCSELLALMIRFILASGYQPGSIARSCARMAKELEDWDGKTRKASEAEAKERRIQFSEVCSQCGTGMTENIALCDSCIAHNLEEAQLRWSGIHPDNMPGQPRPQEGEEASDETRE
jgi:hypothetical protein